MVTAVILGQIRYESLLSAFSHTWEVEMNTFSLL